jgi:hypothetical protein
VRYEGKKIKQDWNKLNHSRVSPGGLRGDIGGKENPPFLLPLVRPAPIPVRVESLNFSYSHLFSLSLSKKLFNFFVDLKKCGHFERNGSCFLESLACLQACSF